MSIFSDDVKQQLSDALKDMVNMVYLTYFTQEIECRTCQDTREFVEEISVLSAKIDLEVLEFEKNESKAAAYGVDKIPAILLSDQDHRDTGIRFYGIPAGYEINSFLTALLEVSGKKEYLPEVFTERIHHITKDIHIQVFVTLTCPYCPQAVITAHRLALENDHIRADMIESSSFPELVVRYAVSGVPKIIVNETQEFVGAQPMNKFLEEIEKI